MPEEESLEEKKQVKPSTDENSAPVTAAEGEGDLGQDSDADHEVKHSDEYERESLFALNKMNFIFVGMAFLGMLIALGGILFLISTIEGTFSEEIDEDVTPLYTLRGEIYYRQTNAAQAELISFAGEEEDFTPAREGSLQPFDNSRNPTWQISRPGRTIAYQLAASNQVIVQTNSEADVAFEGSFGRLEDWVLTQDGQYVIGRFTDGGQKLVRYDIISTENTLIDGDFTSGSQAGQSRLYVGLDGVVRWFVFTGDTLLTQIIALVDGTELDPVTIDSPRIQPNSRIEYNALSPDGQWFIFSFDAGGREYLGQVSLNSRTGRIIYESTEGSTVDDILWSNDSRTLAVVESSGGSVARVVRLDTGPLTTEVLVGPETEGLNVASPLAQNIAWTEDGKRLTFINGDALFSLDAQIPEVEEEEQTAEEESNQEAEPATEPQPRLIKLFDQIRPLTSGRFGWVDTGTVLNNETAPR